MKIGFIGSGTYLEYFCTECGYHPMVKLDDDSAEEHKRAAEYLERKVIEHREKTGHTRHF